MEIEMINKDLRSTKQQLENIDTVTTNRKELQRSAQLHILGIAGSMRQSSYSTQVLKMVLEESKKYKTDTQILELRQVNLPIYDPSASNESNNNNNDIERVGNALKWADSIILSSPDYHGSMSGAMKNFLDYFWEEFAGKTFAYLCTSHEKGLTVMDQMRTAVRQCYGWSIPYGVSINGEQDFNAKGEIINSILARRINMVARDLSVYGKLIREQFQRDLVGNNSDTFAARY